MEAIIKRNDEKKLFEFFDKFSENQLSKYERLYKNLHPYLKNDINIITISNSDTIRNIFLKIHSEFKINSVFVSESRPQFEGREIAKFFSENNINTHIVLEAAIPRYINQSDICLIGADKILSNGNVINKVGSNLLALNCKYFNIPFLVLADSSKFSDETIFNEKKKSVSEIWAEAPKNIIIDNFYFEEINKELITKLISD